MSSSHLSSSAGGSRRMRYSRSPPGSSVPPFKRSKPSSSGDADHRSDSNRAYTSICVKNINPDISDSGVRERCAEKFSKYGPNSVKIYYRNQERMAFVNFTNCDDARRACHARTGLVWDNIQVVLEPIHYRRTVPADQPLNSGSPRGRSPSPPKRRPRRPSPSPPRITSRSRHHHTSSPPPPPSRSRRHYSPYIPLPPDLVDYVEPKGSRRRQASSPSPPPRQRQRNRSRSMSASPVGHKSRGKHDDPAAGRGESNVQHDPTRTLFVGNLEREVKESKLREVFGRYGTIEEIDLKVPLASAKRAYAFIQYENMDMAFEARRSMDGRFIGKADCKIGYGKIVPTRYLWVGNISMEMKQRDLEQAFARYGQLKSFDYSNGDPTAIVTYDSIEHAIAARTKMTAVTEIVDGRKVRAEPTSPDAVRRAGLRIDYLDRPTARRFVIVRPQGDPPKHRASRSPSASSAASARSRSPRDRPESISPEREPTPDTSKNMRKHSRSTSPLSPSPSPPPSKRRSPSPPVAGQTFYGPYGSYLSSDDTNNISDVNELITLCEKLNAKAKANVSTAYSTKFTLKSQSYDTRLHFLAGSPSLANSVFGHSSNQANEKVELKVTARLRLDPHKFDDLERKFRANVGNALSSTSSSASNSRRQTNPANQTNFAILITTPNAFTSDAGSNSSKQRRSNGRDRSSDHSSDENEDRSRSRREADDDNKDSSLSQLIDYLASKEAAGVVFVPPSSTDEDSVVLNIYPPCQLTKKLLRAICPSISFSNGPRTPPSRPTMANDEHLMAIITYQD